MPTPILANAVVDLFLRGGPIMWPILVACLVAVAVVGERILWWMHFTRLRDPRRLGAVFAAVEEGALDAALRECRGSADPAIKMIEAGLQNYPTSVEEAMQVVATDEVENAGRFLPVMDTLVTLAPLLGLLGTVTGIMGSFSSIGSAELAVEKVTGGIGEALIATAAGLGIAITMLLPCNFFTRKAAQLEVELQKAGTHFQGLLKRIAPRLNDESTQPARELARNR
jgi:biopolymer transport protein ExbB